MSLRIKAGGPTSVISQADAKKMGLIRATVVTAVEKAGAKTATDKKVATAAANKEEKKLPNKENQDDNKKPAGKDSKTTKVITPATGGKPQFDTQKTKKGLEEPDPIEESLN
jgi:hypothetical protein